MVQHDPVGDVVRLGTDTDRLSGEPKPEGERVPCTGQVRPDGQAALLGGHAQEPERKGLPHPSHGGQVQTVHGRAGDVVEVESGGQPEQCECPLRLAGPGQQRRGDGR